jgi:hypothetical protein
MDTKLKRLVASVALAGAITVGTAGAAFAADGSSPSGDDATAQTAHPAHPALRRAARRGVVKVTTDTLGVSRADLVAALKSGESISDYATSLGKNPQDVVTALVNAANARIDKLVANERITADQGATAKSKVPDRVDKIVNHVFGQKQA